MSRPLGRSNATSRDRIARWWHYYALSGSGVRKCTIGTMRIMFDGTVLAHGTTGRADEIITAEVRPDLVREARKHWGAENNIYQCGYRGYKGRSAIMEILRMDGELDELVVRRAEVFRQKQGIDLRTGHRVEAIDSRAKQVSGTTHEGQRFEINFDRLLIATGASPMIPDLSGAALPAVKALKSLADGKAIQAWLAERTVQRAVILGMGYIALEMCEALRARGLAVDMIKPGPVLLPWLHPDLTAVVRQEMEANQVGIHLGRQLQRIEPAGEEGFQVLSDGPTLECELVLLAIGVAPNSQLAEKAGLQLGPQRSIHVDKGLMTSCQDIYAAGDCADAVHVVTGRDVWIPLALRANRAGWAVADNVTGRPVELPGVAGTAVFKVFDLEVARTGLFPKEAQAAGFDPVETTPGGGLSSMQARVEMLRVHLESLLSENLRPVRTLARRLVLSVAAAEDLAQVVPCQAGGCQSAMLPMTAVAGCEPCWR